MNAIKRNLSKAEELSLKNKKIEEEFLEEKMSAENERAQRRANLKALRLEKEAVTLKAEKKLARAVQKKAKKK
jgi:hypothetical protein